MNPQGPEILAQFGELAKQATTLRNGIHDEIYQITRLSGLAERRDRY